MLCNAMATLIKSDLMMSMAINRCCRSPTERNQIKKQVKRAMRNKP